MKINIFFKILLSILSGLILSLGWTEAKVGWMVFFGFVPLLFIMEALTKPNIKNRIKSFFGYAYISFFVWNLSTTWWIYHATVPGAVAAIILSALFMSFVISLVFKTVLIFGRRIGYIAFICFWLSFEYIFLNSQVSWPWLVLGNAFANNIKIIQWYEFFGHFGGSLWVLIINLLLFEIIRFFISKIPGQVIIKYIIFLLLFIFIPIIYSFIRYYTYKEVENPVDIVIIQPNIDSYVEKYTIPPEEQIKKIIELAEKKADFNVDYFVAPETAIPYGMDESTMNNDYRIILLKSFLKKYPSANLIIGADTRRIYYKGVGKTKTARPIKNSEDYYDIFNTALQIDTSKNIQVYHKSKLVPGVEMLPYPQIFGFLENMLLDLGGMFGSHGTQKERTVMKNNRKLISVGVPICYESVYGEFVNEWIKNGANLLFVITNDGWWEDTPGYKQHHSFSRLRAIETRRSIARSANTGISSFINQRGDIIEYLGWDIKGTIRQNLNANDKISFYVKYGDFLPRMSLVITIILLIVQLVNAVLKKAAIHRKK